MSRVYGGDLFEYRGYIYAPEDDIEEDNIKRFHNIYCEHEGIRCNVGSVPLSPYSSLNEAQFRRWIDMGKPTRDRMGGHHHEDHERYFRKLFDEAMNRIILGEDDES